jgi:hypothetical protein
LNRSILARAALFAALALFTSCGSSGGGGGSASQGVTLQLMSPTSISADLPVGGSLPNVDLVAQPTGDLKSLAGKTINVTVLDRDALFSTQGGATLVARFDGTYVLSLTGAPQAAGGHKVGKVEVDVTVDGKALGGTPFLIPYDVQVEPGIQMNAQSLAVASTFGDGPFTRTFSLTPPPGTTAIQVQQVNSPLLFGVPPTVKAAVDGTLTFTFNPLSPSNYILIYSITTTGAFQDGRTRYESVNLTVYYNVANNPSLDYVTLPIEGLHLSVPFGTAGTQTASYAIIPNVAQGVTLNAGVFFEYKTSPAGAAGNPNLDRWAIFPGGTFFGEGLFTYSDAASLGPALPAGTYTAVISAGISKNNTVQYATLPVTLTITP